jgi:hypothetical protein
MVESGRRGPSGDVLVRHRFDTSGSSRVQDVGMSCRIAAGLVALTLLAGCSSSNGTAPTAAPSSAAPSSAAPSSAAGQAYVDSVNGLCDALLPKVLAVMQGGHSGTYPVTTFFAEFPAHRRLLVQFDRDLARIPVPPAAGPAHRALADYIAFANRIDAARLQAAHNGQAAFDALIRRQDATALDDPTIAARSAAGFADSCNAR